MRKAPLVIAKWRALRWYNNAYATEKGDSLEIVIYPLGRWRWRVLCKVADATLLDRDVQDAECASTLIVEKLDAVVRALFGTTPQAVIRKKARKA